MFKAYLNFIYLALLFFSVASFASEKNIWFNAEHHNAVAIVVHGINLSPDKMNPIVTSLNNTGIDVLRVTLTGHDGDEEAFKKVTREQWLNDMYQAYCQARQKADERKVPLYFVGFSLGALMNIDLMVNFPKLQIHYDKMVLFSPALVLNSISYLVRFFSIFGNDFVVPSIDDLEYRANKNGTPITAYSALFVSVDALENKHFDSSINIPTLIIIDPNDEVVNFTGIKEIIAEQKLTQWKITKVSNFASTLRNKYHHFTIDEVSLGPWVWPEVQKTMSAHLQGLEVAGELNNQIACNQAKAWYTSNNIYCEKDWWPHCDRQQNECAPLLLPNSNF